MLGSLGFPEIAFILVLALLVFGPRRLPEVGRKVGRAMGEFRRATGDLKRSIDREMTRADMGGDRSTPASTRPRSGAAAADEPVPEPVRPAGESSAETPEEPDEAATN